ncbi:GNAT family N-acetyltransferase [Streptomyces sp. NPDC087270]|uniref:GNAT family N-acetyltransferase n=1 Tax=Streptomyces sp. NPDC087270 TaxID=3365774 RepID=UPI003821DC10
MAFRTATARDLPDLLALLMGEEGVVDPGGVEVSDAHEVAFAAIESDDRNEIAVLEGDDGAVLGCLQLTYIPGLTRGGQERALIEAVRIRADLRGAGLGRELLTWAIERARARGCGLVQLTSHARRADAHRFYESLGFVRSHHGFKREL